MSVISSRAKLFWYEKLQKREIQETRENSKYQNNFALILTLSLYRIKI
jgi:hypothetical protein